tara:strand:+ start:755 stop:940 length:186 start_codon:yes stop_codon:yes gene_type:complete
MSKFRVEIAYEVNIVLEINDVHDKATAYDVAMEIINMEGVPEDADVVHRDYFVTDIIEVVV